MLKTDYEHCTVKFGQRKDTSQYFRFRHLNYACSDMDTCLTCSSRRYLQSVKLWTYLESTQKRIYNFSSFCINIWGNFANQVGASKSSFVIDCAVKSCQHSRGIFCLAGRTKLPIRQRSSTYFTPYVSKNIVQTEVFRNHGDERGRREVSALLESCRGRVGRDDVPHTRRMRLLYR